MFTLDQISYTCTIEVPIVDIFWAFGSGFYLNGHKQVELVYECTPIDPELLKQKLNRVYDIIIDEILKNINH